MSKGRLRPVPDLLTWAQCFCQYAGVVVTAHPKPVGRFGYDAVRRPPLGRGLVASLRQLLQTAASVVREGKVWQARPGTLHQVHTGGQSW